MRQDTYIGKDFEVDFLKFKKIHGKGTSRRLMVLMKEETKELENLGVLNQ